MNHRAVERWTQTIRQDINPDSLLKADVYNLGRNLCRAVLRAMITYDINDNFVNLIHVTEVDDNDNA